MIANEHRIAAMLAREGLTTGGPEGTGDTAETGISRRSALRGLAAGAGATATALWLNRLDLLAQNPAAPSLRTHKVNLAGVKVYSSSVSGDLRVIWRYADGVLDVIDLLDVGGHEGSRGVYR